MRKALIAFITSAALVLGYGYWHVGRHGTLYVSFTDRSNQKDDGKVFNARLAFFDASGQLLARAVTDDRHGVVWPEHPVAGRCGPALSGEAYQNCFRTHTRWLITWVPQIIKAEVQTEKCHIRDIPVTVHNHPDNVFLWWIPLPHVGGVPRSNYSFDITIDGHACHAVLR